jgi:ATP-dependent Clp protease protease subunit
MGGLSGQATDIAIHADEILNIRHLTNEIMAHHTHQSLRTIEKSVERDNIMTAFKAKEFGIVDEILSRPGQELFNPTLRKGPRLAAQPR